MLDANATHISLVIHGVSADFQVLSFVGHEALNQLYNFDIKLVSTDRTLDLETLLHKTACLTFGANADRVVHGIVGRAVKHRSGQRIAHYSITLTPQLSLLDQVWDKRIFQHLSVPEIITQVLKVHGIFSNTYRFELCAQYPKRRYCLQYNESNLSFLLRLCEEEGIHLHFQHTAQEHMLVFGDNQLVFPALAPVAYQPHSGMAAQTQVITQFNVRLEIRTAQVTLRNHDLEKPHVRLEARANSDLAPDVENYYYPADFVERRRGSHRAIRALERQVFDYKLAEGASDEASLACGHALPLTEHPNATFNERWLLLDVFHEGKQPQVLGELIGGDVEPDDDEFQQGYRNRFRAIPWSTNYRPPLAHPKPKIPNAETAVVTGPEGEEIHCDEYGRIKVQFYWDRSGNTGDLTSCWVHVANTWAGQKFGSIAIPRIGMEVLVTFLNGDHDRPLVTGCLYNERNQPPYPLPTHKTRTTFKTLSSPGGKGFNELRLEDKKGEEQIFMHAQRDWEQRIEHDQKITVGNERHETVESHDFSEVKAQEHGIVHADRKSEVRGNDHLTVGQDRHLKVGAGLFIDAGEEIHYRAGEKVVVEAGLEMTLKAGGSFIRLDAGGITLSGPNITLNGRGTAGVGSGIKILGPALPGAANTYTPGQKLQGAPRSHKARYLLLDEKTGEPLVGVAYTLAQADGTRLQGYTDHEGKTFTAHSSDPAAVDLDIHISKPEPAEPQFRTGERTPMETSLDYRTTDPEGQ